jgi:hypothetical protein
MAESENDRLALAVVERHRDFELALAGDRRSYPTREFRSFANAATDTFGPFKAMNSFTEASSRRSTASSITVRGYPETQNAWNPCCFSVTIRSSKETSRLVFDLAIRFAKYSGSQANWAKRSKASDRDGKGRCSY